MEIKTVTSSTVLVMNDKEFEHIKDALEVYHKTLISDSEVLKKNEGEDSKTFNEMIKLAMEVEDICQDLGMEGYEFS